MVLIAMLAASFFGGVIVAVGVCWLLHILLSGLARAQQWEDSHS